VSPSPEIGNIYAGFEVFTAVTMKNAVFWDIKPSSYITGDTLRLRYRALAVNAMKDLRFHGGGYEERRLLGCYAVWLL
jgi:hypothetical protein